MAFKCSTKDYRMMFAEVTQEPTILTDLRSHSEEDKFNTNFGLQFIFVCAIINSNIYLSLLEHQ